MSAAGHEPSGPFNWLEAVAATPRNRRSPTATITVFVELVGVLLVAGVVYALTHPMSIRNYPTATEWQEAPDTAEQEQRAYATMAAFFMVLAGPGLVVAGPAGVLS